MKSSVVALFSVNLMYSVNHMSVKVMLHCNGRNEIFFEKKIHGKEVSLEVGKEAASRNLSF